MGWGGGDGNGSEGLVPRKGLLFSTVFSVDIMGYRQYLRVIDVCLTFFGFYYRLVLSKFYEFWYKIKRSILKMVIVGEIPVIHFISKNCYQSEFSNRFSVDNTSIF